MSSFIIFLLALFIFLAMNIPIAFCLGLASLVLMFTSSVGGLPALLVAQRMYEGVDSFPLLAIPLFLLAGSLMERGGMSARIVKVASALLGSLRGGLSMVSIASCMFFAGISGSAVADSAAVGGVILPVMKEKGYDRDFSGAVLATAGTIGPVIPPSLPMVIYGVITNVSIGRLFLGGVIPGILIGLGLMAVAYYLGIKRGFPAGERVSLQEAWKALKESSLTLGAPLIIVVGIITGTFTPTEAAAIAVVYSFVIGVFVYKDLKISQFPGIMLDTAVSSALVMFIVSASSLSAWLIAVEQIPKYVAETFATISNNPIVILIIINCFLLVWGMIMDLTPSIMILAPIFLPLLNKLGIDLTYFGVIMVVNLCIGLVTPPVGTVLYVVSEMSKVKPMTLSRAALPFLLVMCGVLVLMILIPETVMWLPRLIMGN